jgi:hypothetical protein
LGSFTITVLPAFQAAFNGCTGYDATTHKFKSPTLYDPATIIGRSAVIQDGDASDTDPTGVQVGSANTRVPESILVPPSDYPCGTISGCTSGATTREVHTEVHSLKMAEFSGSGVTVRAGVWYDDPTKKTDPPSKISPGEVESQSGPGGADTRDFPASSFFNVYVQVDVPKCGGMTSDVILYNDTGLLVKNYALTVFPPKVVYLHDATDSVPIKILGGDGTPVGTIELAGHGVGFTNSDADQKTFNDYMNCVSQSRTSPNGIALLCSYSDKTFTISPDGTASTTKSTSPTVAKPATNKP